MNIPWRCIVGGHRDSKGRWLRPYRHGYSARRTCALCGRTV